MAVITIAREYGSGGKEIGEAVARMMGYQYVDRGKILDDLKKAGPQWEEQADQFDENQPSIWERHKWSFRAYVALVQSSILRYACQDKVVIMGREGNFLLKGIPFALRIRTMASVETRIDNLTRSEEINREQARWLIEKADKDMAGAVYMIYGGQWDDPTQYDMVFDTGALLSYEIITAIRDELPKREQFNTEEARQVLVLRALAAHIKAEIAVDPGFFISSLDVGFKEAGLVKYGLLLQGVSHHPDDAKRIEERAGQLAGDVPIEFKVQYRAYARFNPRQFK